MPNELSNEELLKMINRRLKLKKIEKHQTNEYPSGSLIHLRRHSSLIDVVQESEALILQTMREEKDNKSRIKMYGQTKLIDS